MTDAYDTVILADTPVGYWPLNDPGGTTSGVDASGNGHPMANHGSPPYGATAIVPAVAGTSANLGSGQLIATGYSPNLNTALSAECWLNNNSTPGGDPRLISTGHADSDGAGFELVWRVSGDSSRINLSLGNGAGSNTWLSGSVLTTATLYHIVSTWDGTTMKMYVNNVMVASGASSGTPSAPTSAVALGYNNVYNGDGIDALMEKVALYNYALTSTQVTAHYNAGVGVVAAPFLGIAMAVQH